MKITRKEKLFAITLLFLGSIFLYSDLVHAAPSPVGSVSIDYVNNDSPQALNSSSNPQNTSGRSAGPSVFYSWVDFNGTPQAGQIYLDGAFQGNAADYASNPGREEVWVPQNASGSHTVMIRLLMQYASYDPVSGSYLGIATQWVSSPAYTFYVAPLDATITVNNGTCPSGTPWSSSAGWNGTAPSTFTATPSAGGDNVSVSANPPPGYTWSGTSPSSQMIYRNGTYSYTLDCFQGQPPAPVTITSNITNINSCGQSATLTWSSNNATSCVASWTGASIPISGTQSGMGAGTYSITCSNEFGSRTSVPVSVTSSAGSCPSGAPTVNVSASPSSISSGGSSVVSWSTTNATSCSSDWWSGSTALSGSATVAPGVTTTYTKTCSNANGSNSGSATVTVNPVASVSLSPATQTIANGSSGTLSWTGTNVSSCSGTSPANWTGSSVTNGSASVSPSATTTYSISCVSSVGGANPSANATVNVNSASGPGSPGGGAGGSFDYSLSGPSSLSIPQGQTNSITITKTLTPGTTAQSVDMDISPAPAGVGVSYGNRACVTTCSSNIIFDVPSSTAPGTYPITVTGFPLNKTKNFNLIITASSDILVTCTPSSSTSLVGVPVTWNSTVSGGNGVYTSYVWTGNNLPTPAPSTSSFKVTYSTVGQKTAQLTVTDSVGNTGSCAPGTVQINFNPQFKEI